MTKITKLEKEMQYINKTIKNLELLSNLSKRANCSQCKQKHRWKSKNGDFICISILKKPVKHKELGHSKNNNIRKCISIKGIGRRVEEMTWDECAIIVSLSTKILKQLGKI